MIPGIEIKFDKSNNNHFENMINEDIDSDILIISLLETINDICKSKNINISNIFNNYLKLGSVDIPIIPLDLTSRNPESASIAQEICININKELQTNIYDYINEKRY